MSAAMEAASRLALAALTFVAAARGPAAASPGTEPPAPDDVARQLVDRAAGAVVAVLGEPRPGALPFVALGTRVHAPVDHLRARLADPETYRRAVPAFVEADVVTAGLPSLVSWELEVPLWNLSGRLLLRARGAEVELRLVEGDLAPGIFTLRALPAGEDAILWVEARASLRGANFMTRRLAARHPLADPAMVATAAFVLLRGLALEAEGGPATAPPRRPRDPPAAALDAMPELTGLAWPPAGATRAWLGGRTLAQIRIRDGGRLDRVVVAAPVAADPAVLRARLAAPLPWRALPGWGDLQATAVPGGWRWDVDAGLPFVDLDAVWRVEAGPPLRAHVIEGDWIGPALQLDVAPGPTGALVTCTANLRVDRTGYVARRLIEAEPLLEHGLSLGLAYVNTTMLIRAATENQR